MACLSADCSWSSLCSNPFEATAGKFICFTRLLEDLLLISVTDGINLWQIELNEDDVKSYKVAAGLDSKEEYLTNIKNAIQKSELQVSNLPQRLMLHFGSKPGSISLDLFEATSQQKREGLQKLIFNLAADVKSLEGKLQDSNDKLKQVEDSAKINSPDASPFKDANLRKSKVVPRPRQAKGHSIINPGSKRKKIAKGVMFD